jgi:phage terminase large subunit GpA-like protein
MTARVDPESLAVLDHFDGEHEARLAEQIRELIAQSFSPPPTWSVAEWADERRYLSSEAASEPGKWKTSRVEPSRGVMDAFSDPEIEQISCMVAAQTFKTEVLLNISGFYVDLDPCPMLILQPTLQMAEAFSKDRLAPMCRDTPTLSKKIGEHARDSEDTILHKKYLGGHITLAGANSPASLASRPIRILLCDEVDRYEASAGKEGDPVSLAIERTTTFHNRKIALFSTPLIKGSSRIEAAYEESDQRRYFVPCQHCQHPQHLRWAQVHYPGRRDGVVPARPEEAAYVCESCGVPWSEGERLESIACGRWIATRPEVKGHAGFHLNRIASPWRPLWEMARDFEAAKRFPNRLKTWVNTRLAETWEERGERVDATGLLARLEPYGTKPIPAGVGAVSCGVDIQDDRYEIEWLGNGAGDETWSLDYFVRYGDPSTKGFWESLDHAILRAFDHPSGITMRAEATCIDSGGHFTQQVYDFVRPRSGRGVYAIKGMSGQGRPIWPPKGSKNAAKNITLYILGVDQAKSTFYKQLAITSPGPGYCHFPKRPDDHEGYRYDKTHFDGLTAEKVVTVTDKKGFTKREWKREHVRNEPLDCRVYALAARLSLGINMDRRLAALRAASEARERTTGRAPVDVAPQVDQGSPDEAPSVPHAARPHRRMRSRGIQA